MAWRKLARPGGQPKLYFTECLTSCAKTIRDQIYWKYIFRCYSTPKTERDRDEHRTNETIEFDFDFSKRQLNSCTKSFWKFFVAKFFEYRLPDGKIWSDCLLDLAGWNRKSRWIIWIWKLLVVAAIHRLAEFNAFAIRNQRKKNVSHRHFPCQSECFYFSSGFHCLARFSSSAPVLLSLLHERAHNHPKTPGRICIQQINLQ